MRNIIYILLTAFFILMGYFSINRLIEKPDVPFEYYSNNSGVYVKEAGGDINQIFSVDGILVRSPFQLEFVIDRYRIGSTVSLTYSDLSGKTLSSDFEINPYYHSKTFIIATGMVGFIFLLMGLFVVVKSDSVQALLLYWVLSLYGLATLTSPGYYFPSGDWVGYIIRFSHAVSYSIGSLFVILFIISFPLNRLKQRKSFIVFNIILAAIVALFSAISQQYSIIKNTNGSIFEISWIAVLAFLVYSLAAAIYMFVKEFKLTLGKEDRRRMEWIIWGLIVGVSPYILLWVIPGILGLPYIVKEEYLLLFLVFVPISFVIAVIKYQVMDIELVVKRSFVYTMLSVCLIGIYIGLIYLSNLLFDYILGTETKFINLLAVLITALTFNPLRDRLNKFADKVFYREKYVFDKAVKEVLLHFKECLTAAELGKTIISEIERLIPVASIAIFVNKNGEDRLRVLEHKNFWQLTQNISALRMKKLASDFTLPLARENKAEKGVNVDTSMEPVFKRWNINAAIPLVLENYRPIGAIVLGDKLSGLKYSGADIELLTSIANIAAIELDRIFLQEKIIAEEIELSKLEELNRLKSFYVASVSHDLKTPLTSIKVFTELMQSEKRIPVEKRNEYLKIITGETDRLSRLIDNVLDFAKIEKGIKQYSFSPVELNKILKCVFKSIEHTLKMNKFKVVTKFSSKSIKINGDSDAIQSVLFNIISNSIKYSQTDKHINISSGTSNGMAFIEIEDKGIGIPDSDQMLIFNPFFRSSSNKINEVKGAGLGLAIVKHVMDAHNGTIELTSKVNTGTKIRLIFPIKHD